MLFTVLSTLLQIIGFIFAFSLLIIVHELGHYFVAKWMRIRVEEFGLGFPPKVKRLFTHKGTEFTLNWIPFGGFVKLEGEDLASEAQALEQQAAAEKKNKGKTKPLITDKERPFYAAPRLARLLVIFAGPLTNFLFGVLIFSMYYSVVGIPAPTNNLLPRIAEVMPNSPASQAGVPVNVELRRLVIDQQTVEVKTAEQALTTIRSAEGKTLKLVTSEVCTVEGCPAPEKTYEVFVRPPSLVNPEERGVGIYIGQAVTPRFYPWYEMPFRGMAEGLRHSVFLSLSIVDQLGQLGQTLFRMRVPDQLASPIRLFSDGQKLGFFSAGLAMWAVFTAIISINLAIFNLLPIPVIDGGR